MKLMQEVWRSGDPSVGLLRLNMSAQARRMAGVLGQAETTDGIIEFVTADLAKAPAIVAKPTPSHGNTTYLLIGQRFVFPTQLVEIRRNQHWTEPPALNVTDIWDAGPSALERLREIAFKPDPAQFTFEVQVNPEDRYYNEFVYWLTGSAEG